MNTIETSKPHISLNVRNISESVEFYQKLFGSSPVKFIKADTTGGTDSRRMGYAKFDLESPALNFVLNEVPYTPGGSLSHLGIQVAATEDVLNTRDRWIAEGLITADEMKVDCCYALQDKTWARDPDGNEWEVFVVLENTEPAAESCGCGDKPGKVAVSAEPCCGDTQKMSTIGATAAPCC